MLAKLLCLGVGYCVGCISSAYIIGRIMKKDLRAEGSGNLGSTNALRVLGKRAGLITFICDVMKAIISFLICRILFKDFAMAGIYGCVGAVIGHDFPFYLKFRGGKGIATMIGMTLCFLTIDVRPTLLCYAVGIIGLFTRYVSVGSMAFAVAIPVFTYMFGFDREIVLLALGLSLLAVYRHRANIARLAAGSENRLGAKKA